MALAKLMVSEVCVPPADPGGCQLLEVPRRSSVFQITGDQRVYLLIISVVWTLASYHNYLYYLGTSTLIPVPCSYLDKKLVH
jgi:hypothetical protein